MSEISEDDQAFSALKRRIYRDRGLDTSQYKDSYIKRRLATRMRANGVTNYLEYMRLLSKNPDEYKPLLNALTINVTEFFRNPETYKVIKGILRDIIEEKERLNRSLIRIWSAGCSSGEEPYSIAILLCEILGNRINNFNISIHATDIDDRILIKAKAGEYQKDHLKNVSKACLHKYFIFDRESDMYTVKEELKKLIKFKKHDLISGRKLGLFDMILCRNVVIYFSRELQERLYMDFYDSLTEGGYFVMGKTESLIGEAHVKAESFNKPERIYRKVSKKVVEAAII